MKIKKEPRAFDVETFLHSAGVAKNIEVRNRKTLFCQGDPSENVMYLQKGDVKISVVSKTGKETRLATRTREAGCNRQENHQRIFRNRTQNTDSHRPCQLAAGRGADHR